MNDTVNEGEYPIRDDPEPAQPVSEHPSTERRDPNRIGATDGKRAEPALTPKPIAATAPIRSPGTSPFPLRLASIDAYRGFVMFLMMGEVLQFRTIAEAKPAIKLWKILAHNQEHVEWIGCTLHDMIQPSFSFLVGVALPFSIASRRLKGQSSFKMTIHAFWRALVLVLLGVFLRSKNDTQTNFTFEDTLSQIGLGYGFLFMLGFRSARFQWIALVLILAGYWGAFAAYKVPADFDFTKVGVPADWPHLLTGFQSHWNKNANLAWEFDRWFLNLFPRKHRFEYNGGGYATLSFIPTLGTMILGLIAGGILKGDRPKWAKIALFIVIGAATFGAGYALGRYEICPIVKRIWTPSWTLYSGGICFFMLAGFYAIVDGIGLKFPFFPLIVIGMNSIAAYCMAGLFEHFFWKNLETHLGAKAFRVFGPEYATTFHGALTLLCLWLILFWMYRRKVFLRI
jgi:heparan-alpha-glucosaminide N-acetyltransferase